MKRGSKFVIRKAINGFYFQLYSANGRLLVTSDRYKTKQNAQIGIEAVRKNLNAPVVDE